MILVPTGQALKARLLSYCWIKAYRLSLGWTAGKTQVDSRSPSCSKGLISQKGNTKGSIACHYLPTSKWQKNELESDELAMETQP